MQNCPKRSENVQHARGNRKYLTQNSNIMFLDIIHRPVFIWSRGSVVGIATGYGLDD
jgi:hypothetical protein